MNGFNETNICTMDDTFLETYLETREIKKVRMTFRLPVSILNDTGVLSGGGKGRYNVVNEISTSRELWSLMNERTSITIFFTPREKVSL